MEKLGKKLKHDHTLTSILKFAIFSVIMLAPIFSVASRCLYVICNKNAKDSYSGANGYQINYRFETNEIETIDDLQVGNLYRYTPNENNLPTSNTNIVYSSYIHMEWVNNTDDIDVFEIDVDKVNANIYLQFVITQTSNLLYIRNANNTNSIASFNIAKITYIDFTFLYNFNSMFISDTNSSPYNEISGITLENNGTLDNAFEYSLSQIEESSYYNWATNLGIYTPIYNMVHGLGGHDIIALLLAYWSIYTAIYIVFDIIIACFVKITHLLQSE